MATTDTFNKFIVGMNGRGQISVLGLRDLVITKEEALNLAAYLVCLADPLGEEFTQVLEAVRNA